MLDDGQFGQATVLTQFNWARGYSEGGEFKLSYTDGNFHAYAISPTTFRVRSGLNRTNICSIRTSSLICKPTGITPTTCSA